MSLLPWQRWLVIHALEIVEGRWRFRTVLVLVARQNGKTSLLKVLALYWLFVEQVALVLGTSTKLDYARESWDGAVQLARSAPDLSEMVPAGAAGVRRANGEQTMTTIDGCRYKIAAANADAGRSLTVHRLVLDELRQHKTWDAWGAATKAQNAVPDAQCWCITNAGEDDSVVLNDLRAKALETIDADVNGQIGLFEWSAPDGCPLGDVDGLLQANPATGYTIELATLLDQARTDPEPVHRTEVMCQSVTSLDAWQARFSAGWQQCTDPSSVPDERAGVAFSVEVSQDREMATIGMAGLTEDGRPHVEVAHRRRGTRWVIDELLRLQRQYRAPVAIDPSSPAGSLLEDLEAAGVEVAKPTSVDIVGACGALYDLVTGEAAGEDDAADVVRLVHRGQNDLTAAAGSAGRRSIADAWRFDRRGEADISPLYAVTLARWAWQTQLNTATYAATPGVWAV